MCNFCAENIKLRKKRKRSSVDNVLNDMVDKLLKREDADKRFMEFEEKRLKLEEQMEERRQIREQEHDKQMQMVFLQLMQQAMHRNLYAPFLAMPTYEGDI